MLVTSVTGIYGIAVSNFSMRNRQTILALAILLIAPALVAQTPLEFRIESAKAAAVQGQDIELKFTLRNTSQKRVLAVREAGLHDFVYLDIFDEHNRRVGWTGPITSRAYSAKTFITLKPRESTTFDAVISYATGRGYGLQHPGWYRLRAEFSLSPKEYFAPVASGAVIPEKAISSNWIKLKVAKKSDK
jgi:hypothetical protein